MKNNINVLLQSTSISNYRISKATGIAQTTLGDYSTGKSKIGNMKLDHALVLNDYYNENKEELKMEKAIKEIEKVKFGWLSHAVDVLGGVESVAEDYVEVMDHEELDVTAEQFIVEELDRDHRVKEDTEYDSESEASEDGFIWVDEIDKWVKTD